MRDFAPLPIFLSLLLLLAVPARSETVGNVRSDTAELSGDGQTILVESAHPSVCEVRQGGKTILSGVIPVGTDEIDLPNGLKQGEFELLLHPLVYRRTLDAAKQGTGLGDLLRPKGIALDVSRQVVVADSGNDRVQIFTPTLLPAFEFGGFNWRERNVSFNRLSDSTRGTFNGPADVACTIRDIYVTDRDNHRVQKFDRDGNFLLSFGGSGGGRGLFTFPTGIASDRMGNVYVVDSRNDRIQKFDGNGNFILEIGGFGNSESRFNRQRDVAVDADSRIHVLDHGNRRVQVFDRYGHYSGEFPLPAEGEFDSLAIVLEALVAITDTTGGRALLMTREGEIAAVLDGLDAPTGIAADSDGGLFIVEAGASRILRFERTIDRTRFRFRND